MEYGIPLKIDNLDTNITDEDYPLFSNTGAYPKDFFTIYNEAIYKARTNIYKLATYSWNEYDEADNGIVTKLDDKSIILNTLVPCVKDVTTVYIEDSNKTGIVGKYYIFTGTSGNIDFTTTDPTNPSNWEEVTSVRGFDVIPPSATELSLYWEYIDVLNSKKHLDGTIWTQTVAQAGVTTITNYYTITEDFVNIIAFFNLDCNSIEVTVRSAVDNSVLVDTKEIDLYDYQGIVSPYEWHFTQLGARLKNSFVRIPIYANIIIQVDYIGANPKVGEIVFARSVSLGKTLDKPTGRKKKFDKITIDENGKKTVIKSKSMIDELSYNIIVNKEVADSKVTELSKLLNDDILIIGDETGEYTNLINYGSITEQPYEFDSGSSVNFLQITVNTLS